MVMTLSNGVHLHNESPEQNCHIIFVEVNGTDLLLGVGFGVDNSMFPVLCGIVNVFST